MKKELLKEGIGIVSELASKTHKPNYELDLSDLESPEQAFKRIYGEPASEIPSDESLPNNLALKEPPETEKTRDHTTEEASPPDATRESVATSSQKDKGTACLPCTLSHTSACVGLLNEAVRFARDDITSPEVSSRVDNCLSEIAAAERGDLIPENIQNLPPEQKKIAEDAATVLRDIRHDIEWWETKEDLENIAAKISNLQHEMSRKWRIARFSDKEREQIKQKAHKLIDAELQ